jgi:hypothetical protein
LFRGFFLPELRPGSPAESPAQAPDTTTIEPSKNSAMLPAAIVALIFMVLLLSLV